MNTTLSAEAATRPAIDAFLTRHINLNALPENTTRLLRMIRDPDCNVDQLKKVIQTDPALTARIIQAVNSVHYALEHKIKSVDRAVTLLGLKAVKEVVVSASLASLCKPMRFGTYDARDLWDHSLGVAIVARELSVKSGRADLEETFLAGMLHDLPLLLAAQSEPAKATELFTLAEGTPGERFSAAEHRVFGFTHTQLGEQLAAKWGLADDDAAVILWHHEPAKAPDEHKNLCRMIQIADTLCCEANIGCPLTCKLQTISDDELAEVGISRDIAADLTKKLPLLLRLNA